MLTRRNNHAAPPAGLDVDVRVDAALTDQLELVQSMEQRSPDLRPLAYQHQDVGIPQSPGPCIDVIGPDRDLAALQLPEAVECAQRVVVVVENRDPHRSVARPATAAGSDDERHERRATDDPPCGSRLALVLARDLETGDLRVGHADVRTLQLLVRDAGDAEAFHLTCTGRRLDGITDLDRCNCGTALRYRHDLHGGAALKKQTQTAN